MAEPDRDWVEWGMPGASLARRARITARQPVVARVAQPARVRRQRLLSPRAPVLVVAAPTVARLVRVRPVIISLAGPVETTMRHPAAALAAWRLATLAHQGRREVAAVVARAVPPRPTPETAGPGVWTRKAPGQVVAAPVALPRGPDRSYRALAGLALPLAAAAVVAGSRDQPGLSVARAALAEAVRSSSL
jgi:hypothetical protein